MKVYKNGVAAVNKNTFCVRKGEVFGLLGPNGAGKTSTFNIMTMALKRSDGDARLFNMSLDDLKINDCLKELIAKHSRHRKVSHFISRIKPINKQFYQIKVYS